MKFNKKSVLTTALASLCLGVALSSSAEFRNVDSQPASYFRGEGSSGSHFVANWGPSYARSGNKSVYVRSYGGGWYGAGTVMARGYGEFDCHGGVWVKGQNGKFEIIDPSNWYYAAPLQYHYGSFNDGWKFISSRLNNFWANQNPSQLYTRFTVNSGRAALLDDFSTWCDYLH